MEANSMLQYTFIVPLLLLVWFIFHAKKSQKKRKPLPPGPPAIPLIGHLHLFNRLVPPYQTLAQLSQKYGGYVWLKFGSHSTLVVSSADAAKDVLKTHDLHFASRPHTSYSEAFLYNGAGLVFAPYGQHWRDLRKVCTVELLTSQRIEYFRSTRALEMKFFLDGLLEASSRREVLNVTEVVYDFTFKLILSMLLGRSHSAITKDESDPAYMFFVHFKEAGEVSTHFHIGDCFPWLKWLDFSIPGMKKLGKKIDDFLQHQLEEHKVKFDRHNLKDFMDVLISISQSSNLTETSIKAVTLDLLAGGLETSAIAVEWTLAELVRNPDVLKKVQKELATNIPAGEEMVSENYLSSLQYLEAVIKENFRLHPPIPMLIPHLSTSECKLDAGYVIPENTQTIINAYAIGRDGSAWRDPLKFNPERMMDGEKLVELETSFELLPFGSGRRSCPGRNLGMVTVEFMLANLLHKFNWETVEHVDVREASAFPLKRANPLKLIAVAK